MNEVVEKMIAALVVAFLLCVSTLKMPCAMQQSGYKNAVFFRWLKRKNNLLFNRLAFLALCLALASAITSLCFSFLGVNWALIISAVPFLGLILVYFGVDRKYALKVPAKRTARLTRLVSVYYLFTAIFSYAFISILMILSRLNGSFLYALIAYVPFAISPVLLPVFLCFANGILSIFENSHNQKFIKRAGQVLDESKIIRVAVVGSCGKTSVKNILKTILSEKYSALETPASYNTPMGIAKTILSEEFSGKEIFIAEMGARKAGDIAELCNLVKPDYGVFTAVCPQHIASFGSIEGVFAEKSQILKTGAKVVCGEGLQTWIKDSVEVVYAGASQIKDLRLSGTKTSFTLLLGEKEVEIETSLLGRIAAENIALAATLCFEMGMTVEEITAGIAKLQPAPHRLQLLENNGVYILDDGYNCNIEGAKAAIEVLSQFAGRTCIVTPGIVEGGILEEELNARLGGEIAAKKIDKVILVGDTLVGAVKDGYKQAGGEEERVFTVPTLERAQAELSEWLQTGDAVLFLNDLPDVY